jgi:hypothetical protein
MAVLQQMVMQPTPLGENFISVADVAGPASYQQGARPVISANTFAMQTVRFVNGMGLSQSGTYYARTVSIPGPAKTSVAVRYFVTATGAEVANGTNLSGEIFRFEAIGN